MYKWAGITFLVGMGIILLEWQMARKKKDGITWTDKQRMIGIFWISVVMAALVGGIVYLSD